MSIIFNNIFFVIRSNFNDITIHGFIHVKFFLQFGNLMNKRRIIKNFHHKLISIGDILFNNEFRTGNTLLKCFSIEYCVLEVRHIPSNMMRKSAQFSSFKFLNILTGPNMMLQLMMDHRYIKFGSIGSRHKRQSRPGNRTLLI